ncbi:hypothetical protein DHEL01_v209919 [Diaporthe helianthi]|uniref:F-box domain-containing protein n=1 Tax=Diaporthe helianthi TaxID=158607 RepID=A0A2P5HN71_DIAHE|nr:hypothetical protein DHEL01_v209919 [Diaporthe helianthi]
MRTMESLSSSPTTGRSSTATPTPIISLPAEIWLLVFSIGEFDDYGNFWSTYDHRTMANLCRCCTLFCDLVRPRLYYNFESMIFTNRWHYYNVDKFTRTVCENRELASMVRRLDIQGVLHIEQLMGPSTVAPADVPCDHPASVFTQRAAELGLNFRFYQRRKIYVKGQNDFDHVALLLAQLPRLHTLYLYWFDHGHPIRPSISEPRGSWPWVDSIRNMVLRPCGEPVPFGQYGSPSRHSPFTINHSFTVPNTLLWDVRNLTSLSLTDSIGPRCALPLGSLLELILDHCQCLDDELVNLLKHCTRLRKFVYRASPDASQATPPSPRAVIQALGPAHKTLETLGIAFFDVQGLDGLPRITSLKQFTALRTLYIDVNALWDRHLADNTGSPPNPDMVFTTALPESVEDLALFCLDGFGQRLGFRVEVHLKRLAIDRREKGAFPHLKTLRGKALSPLEHCLLDELLADLRRRHAVLEEVTTLLSNGGLEVILSERDDSCLEFEDLIPFS